jgi:hypothetical protein
MYKRYVLINKGIFIIYFIRMSTNLVVKFSIIGIFNHLFKILCFGIILVLFLYYIS